MNKIPQLIGYTVDAINDIEQAIRYHFVGTTGIPLGEYGNLIRSIKGTSTSGSGGTSISTIAVTTKKPNVIKKYKIQDLGPLLCHLEGYEPIDMASLATLDEQEPEVEPIPEENTEEGL